MGNGIKLEIAANGHEERSRQTVHIKQAATKMDNSVVSRSRENNNSTSKHENCNRQQISMTKESGFEGTTTTACQVT
jgi:hypothetical protein